MHRDSFFRDYVSMQKSHKSTFYNATVVTITCNNVCNKGWQSASKDNGSKFICLFKLWVITHVLCFKGTK